MMNAPCELPNMPDLAISGMVGEDLVQLGGPRPMFLRVAEEYSRRSWGNGVEVE